MSNDSGPILAYAIASRVAAIANCAKSGNKYWERKHGEIIEQLVKQFMPSGSGIDCGTTFDSDRSTHNSLWFRCGFHHMDEHGGYNGWTAHTIHATPYWDGLDIVVGGRNRRGVKDYLQDVYMHALTQRISWAQELRAHVDSSKAG